MKIFLLINVIIEAIAGIAMYLTPRKLPGFGEADNLSTTFISMYGAAALSTAFFAFQAWRYYPNADLTYACLLTLIIFHAGVMTATYRGYRAGLKDMMPVAILHGLLTLGSLYFFLQM